MNKKNLMLTLGILALCFWISTGHAQDHVFFHRPGPGKMLMMGGGPGFMFPMILKKLNLTQEQDTKVQTIMASHRDAFRSLFKQLEAAHETMANRFFTPGRLTSDDVTSQAKPIHQIREQLMNEGLKVAVEVREVLTPEQLTKASQLKQKMQAVQEQMRGVFDDED